MLWVTKRLAPAACAPAIRLAPPRCGPGWSPRRSSCGAGCSARAGSSARSTTTSGAAAFISRDHRLAVEDVTDDGLSAARADPLGALLRAGAPSHLVTRREQLRNQAAADHPAGAGDEHLHPDPVSSDCSLAATVASQALPRPPQASRTVSASRGRRCGPHRCRRRGSARGSPYQNAPVQRIGTRQEGRNDADREGDAGGEGESPDVADVVAVLDPVAADLVEEGVGRDQRQDAGDDRGRRPSTARTACMLRSVIADGAYGLR